MPSLACMAAIARVVSKPSRAVRSHDAAFRCKADAALPHLPCNQCPSHTQSFSCGLIVLEPSFWEGCCKSSADIAASALQFAAFIELPVLLALCREVQMAGLSRLCLLGLSALKPLCSVHGFWQEPLLSCSAGRWRLLPSFPCFSSFPAFLPSCLPSLLPAFVPCLFVFFSVFCFALSCPSLLPEDHDLLVGVDGHDDAEAHREGGHRGASVADEGEGDSHHGEDPADHSDIHEDVEHEREGEGP